MILRMIYRNSFKPRRVYKFLVIFSLAVMLFALIYHNKLLMDKSISTEQFHLDVESRMELNSTEIHEKEIPKLKYILLWTPTITPFDHIRTRGQIPFLINECEYTNCFLTHKKKYFSDQTKFDAIVFSIAALRNLHKLPLYRSPRQKFVAASTEPPQKHPIVNPLYDGYFNWTWTYRLDSDILWRKFGIFNLKKRKIGPQKLMNWDKWSITDSNDHELDKFLSTKKKSVVWIKNSCEASKHNKMQLQYIMDLEKELIDKGLSLVIYSNCSGYNSCGSMIDCTDMIQREFYFYLAFEDYIDEDYVTDILLFALECYAVPVVFGGANYSRFLPPDCYLDAQKLRPNEIANIIDNSLSNFTKFLNYFRWVFHYYYQSIELESEICNICTALNNEEMVQNVTVYDNFRRLWNGEDSVQFSDFIFNAIKDDMLLKNMLKSNISYSDIRKEFVKKHLGDPKDSVFKFDMKKLGITTIETAFMPDELTTDVLSSN